MSDDKFTLPAVGGCLFSAIILFMGVSKAFKQNTNAWNEMLIILMDIGLWVFAIVFALFIAFIIDFVIKATLDKVDGAYVAWEKSNKWCDAIENNFKENKSTMVGMHQNMLILNRENEDLQEEFQKLKGEIEALKKVTGFSVKVVETSAEEEI